MFKSGIICVTLLATLKNGFAITEEHKALIQSKFLEFGAECIKDHPLSADDITSFKDKQFPDGENAGCFMSCIFKKIGLMDDKGSLSHADALEQAKTIFEDEEHLKNVEEFLTTCNKVNDEDVTDGEKGCERAKLLFNCYVENSEKFGFNFEF